MERVAFVMKVKPGQEAEYRRRHAAVWPEMLRALKDAGCSNYSIYMKGRELFAYMEVDDFERFKRRMSENNDALRWELQMAPIMEQAIQADTGFHEVLPEVFHLD
ncbi:MAG: L-rhamnose mutarotase [Chloroflexi bacterium]|nr:MAG: L-rhamnose mutarotase [Chloroflexota bacterium]